MTGDPFGNLKEWGRVIETLEQMKEEGKLDDAQPGLIRLIRYPDNWRIREQALIAVRQVAQPNSGYCQLKLILARLDVSARQ